MNSKRRAQKRRYLGFIDARAVIGKDLLAFGVETGIGGWRIAAGHVAVGGCVVLGGVYHC